MSRPRVGVSACLLGEEVRHDGRHKLSRAVVELVGPEVEWVPVCPEVEVGMGVPREPVALISGRMIGSKSGTDHTEAMNRFAEARIGALGALDGYVLKSRSPSCGLRDAPGGPDQSGLFAAALRRLRPELPLIDETALDDDQQRRAFLTAIRARARARAGGGGAPAR